MGWLEKMIQYKEKSAKQGANSESVRRILCSCSPATPAAA